MTSKHKDLYNRITGLNFENNIIAKLKLDETKKYLRDTECKVLGLNGSFKEIHSSIFITELDSFSSEELTLYANLFDIKLNDKLSLNTQILIFKYKMMETMRSYSYIDSVLFGGVTSDPDHHFYYYNVDNEVIKFNGIQHYYLRCGECTIEDLTERYNRFELAMICGNLSYISDKEYVLKITDSNRDIAAMILSQIDNIKPDARTILTIMGFQVSHQELEFNISRTDVETLNELYEIYKEKGMSTTINNIKLNPIELYHKYILFQLQPRFFTSISETSQYLIKNKFNLMDEDVEDTSIPLFYGIGDGITEYDYFTEDELTKIFQDNGFFINPLTKTEFNLEPIKILMLNCQTEELAGTIRDILPEIQYDFDIENLNYTKEDLISLYNIGLELSDWDKLSSINSLDLYIRNTEILYDTKFYKSLRDKIYNILMKGLTLNFKGMFMVDTIREIDIDKFPFFIDASNSYNSISERIKLLMECNTLGLFSTITYNGNLFLYTAEFYFQHKFKVPLSSTIIEFIETPSI